MLKRTVSGIMLTLLLIGMLTLALNVQLARAEPEKWIVNEDASADFHVTQETINASIDIEDELNLGSKGRWITCYIEVPEGNNVSDIQVSTILLNATIPVDTEACITIGDYDNDTVLDLMVNFNRTSVVDYMLSKSIMYGNATLSLAGKLHRLSFEGSDTLKISSLAGDVDCNGEVAIYDIVLACASYDSTEGEPNWNSNANLAPLWNIIDIYDLLTVAYHYGEEYP